MGEHEKANPTYCRQRAAAFRAKASQAGGWLLKRAYEAAASEYESRAAELEHPRAMAQAIFPKPGR